MTTMRVNRIIANSYTDGPNGARTVLFAQGCPIQCRGCQSPETRPASRGYESEVKDLARTLLLLSEKSNNITLSGGEISAQPEALAELVTILKDAGRHLVMYSGYTFEQLTEPNHPSYPWMKEILSRIDLLIDGPFIAALDTDYTVFAGSSNQRFIDVPATLDAGRVVTIDISGTLTITPDGSLVLPAGLAGELAELGSAQTSPMCGQLNR